jgi:DNA repair exonuclease SbcCD ATPase subunit
MAVEFPAGHESIVELKIGLASAVKDIEINAKVIDKLAEAVEKIEIMNQNLCKMISLHELKHDNTEKTYGAIDEDFKELSSRIDTLMVSKREPKQTTADKLQDAEVKNALAQFNKWKYMATGGLLVIGYLLSHLDAFATFLISLIK